MGRGRRALPARARDRTNHPAGLNSLGLAFQGAGKLDQAAACFQAALQTQPNMIEALNNRAMLHLDAGNAGAALALLVRALGVRENDESQRLLAACLTSGKPLPATDAVRKLVLRALQEGWTGPDDLAGIAESFIKIGPLQDCLRRANAAWPARLLGEGFVRRRGPRSDGEGRAVGLFWRRHATPTSRSSGCSPSRAAVLQLASRAAIELEKTRYLHSPARSRASVSSTNMSGASATRRSSGRGDCAMHLLPPCRTASRSWFRAGGNRGLFPSLFARRSGAARQIRSWPAPVAALLTQQIREPQAERELRASMPRLTPIEDEVSRAVQRQYEENPFPRWVKLVRPGRARTLNRTLRETFPLSGFVRSSRKTASSS